MTEPGAPPRHDVPTGGRSGFVLVDGRQVHELDLGPARGARRWSACTAVARPPTCSRRWGPRSRDRYHVLAPDLPGHGDSDPVEGEITAHAGLRPVPGSGAGRVRHRAGRVRGCVARGHDVDQLRRHPPRRRGGHRAHRRRPRLEPEGVRKIVDFMTAHESFAFAGGGGRLPSASTCPSGGHPASSLTRNLRQRPDGRWEWKHAVGRRMRERRAETGDHTHPADRLDELMAGVDEAAARLPLPGPGPAGRTRATCCRPTGRRRWRTLVPDARLEVIEKAGHLAVGRQPALLHGPDRGVPGRGVAGLTS